MSLRFCQVLDAATGSLITQYMVPELPGGVSISSWSYMNLGYWGYIAVEDGIIFGTVVDPEHITQSAFLDADMSQLFSESKAFFALDAETGEVKWIYVADHSIRHNAIAIGDGKVFLIDRPAAPGDRIFSRRGKEKLQRPAGKLVALDAQTGKLIWQARIRARFSASPIVAGDLLYFAGENGVTYVLRAGDEFDMVAENDLGSPILASPAVFGQQLFIRTQDELVCIGKGATQ